MSVSKGKDLLKRHDVKERLSSIRAFLRGRVPSLVAPFSTVTLFFSVSDGDRRARVFNVSGPSLESAWQKAVVLLRDAMQTAGIKGQWIRVDWVENAEATTWVRLRALLARTKRNYFRFGIALDCDLHFAFTEQELNAHAMLYGGNRIEHAIINEKNFRLYAEARHRDLPPLHFADGEEVFLFSTKGVFCDEHGALHAIEGVGLDAGRRTIETLDEDRVLTLVRDASAYLARQVEPDGTFIYGYHPCFDRRINAYNTLRHASSTYAMIEAWELTRDAALKAAIDRALKHLAEVLIKPARLQDGAEAAFLVDVGEEIKLGGNAVAILALAKYMTVTGTDIYRSLAEQLALGICHMQDQETGAFVHVLKSSDLSVKEKFRTIYYEGEAAFGLMRLYGLTGDPRWLATVEKAFDHFIAQEHWKHHDHWLGYCVNELTRYRPEERYFRFGIRNIAGYLDFVENRITTFPTLLELMMAVRETLSRIADSPRLHWLLDEIDLVHFERALEKRAYYLLNGHFWPETAMYFRKPDRIVGSFFIRHHAFRVRIDDVEHYLSGFIAYRNYLAERAAFRKLVSERAVQHLCNEAATLPEGRGWTAEHVEAATGGTWIRRPTEGWMATGLSTYAPATTPDDLALVRAEGETVGILPQVLHRFPTPAGIITADPDRVQEKEVPLLRIADGNEAVMALGRYARDRMSGKVLAVTGSAGKTTAVAMLAHALSPWGTVGATTRNANLPYGVAWNLASIPWDCAHVVLELAVGRMAVSARMARPQVTLFTNILPAHLGETSTLYDIAHTKSAIFLGMSPGDKAVINRDMLEWETVCGAASNRGLDILTYGESEDCDFRLLGYDAENGFARARFGDHEIDFRVGAAGRHMALNGLAVLASVSALGYPLEPTITQLESFTALPGRGEEFDLMLGGRRLTVIDDAYNANPGSMRAALDRLGDLHCLGRRIAVLGQMADLGPQAASYHTELAAFVKSRSIDRVYVTGELYEGFWCELSSSRKGEYVDSLDRLKNVLLDQLTDGDAVLFKGSNSTRIHELVRWLKQQAGAN